MPSSRSSQLKRHPRPRRNATPSPFNVMSESGQSAVILALMFMMLLAFVGLATDTGIMYVAYGQLRRAVDAASFGAASQLREARSITDTTEMAKQYIQLQGLVLNNIDVDKGLIATEQGVALPTSVAAARNHSMSVTHHANWWCARRLTCNSCRIYHETVLVEQHYTKHRSGQRSGGVWKSLSSLIPQS